MATLSRQVSSGNDDAGETGPAFDPVLGSLPRDDSLEVSFQVQQRLNAINRGGEPRKLVFPPGGSLWCQNELNTYIPAVHDSPPGTTVPRSIDIDFNGCRIYRKLSRVRGHLTRDLEVNDTSFYIRPDVGSFIPAAGSWPTGCTTSGWPTGSFTAPNTHMNIMFNPDARGADPYKTIEDNWGGTNTTTTPGSGDREDISVESVNFTSSGETTPPGEATCAIRFTSGGKRIHGDGGGPAPSVSGFRWPAGTQVEWMMDQTIRGVEVQYTVNSNLWNYNHKGPGPANPNYAGRFFMSGIYFQYNDNLKYRGTINVTNVYGDGIGFQNNNGVDFQATGNIDGCGREAISVVNDRNIIIGSPVDARRPSAKPDSEMLVIRNVQRSEIDLEPETVRGVVDNITIQGLRFRGGGTSAGAIHWAAGAGIKRNLFFIKNHWLTPGELRGGGNISGPTTIIGNDMAPARKTPGAGDHVGPIELTRSVACTIWDNVMPRLPHPITGNLDNYGAALTECGNISMAGNNFGQVAADAAIVIRGSSSEEYRVGQIVGDYPKPYGPGQGRPFAFGADVNAAKQPSPNRSLASPNSDSDVGPVLDPTGLRLPLGTSLRISAGGAATGPQVFYTSQYTEARVAKSAIRCDHGGDKYRDPPAPDQFWGDPFLDETLPMPPNPLPAGHWTGDLSGDWWVVVIDQVRNRSYEYWGSRWDSGGIFHCLWAACYDLDGDGRTTVTGVGAGTASGLSQLFGLLRANELSSSTNGDWPDHPLVSPWDNIKPLQPTSPWPTGFRYPARTTDGKGSTNDDFALCEGTRLFSRVGLNLASCSVRDRKIIHALRVYGFYIMDQGGSDSITFFCSEWGVGALANGTIRTKLPDNSTDADYAGLGIQAHWDGSPRRTAAPTTDQGARAGGTPYGE